MPSNTISLMITALGAGATADVRPPVGEAWVIEYMGSDQPFVGTSFLVPDLEVGLKKGADTVILLIDPSIDDTARYKRMHIDITHDVYMTIKNTAIAPANICVCGEKINLLNIISDIVTIPGGGEIAIDPGNIEFAIDNIGADLWTVAGDINPDITVGFQNAAGTLKKSKIWDPTMVCGHHYMFMDFPISHSCQIIFTGAPGTKVGYIGHKKYSVLGRTGRSISLVDNIQIAGTLVVRPPVNEEWRVRHIAAEKWAGAGVPLDVPNITVSLTDGVSLSNVLEAGLVSVGFFINPFIDIDNNTYLSIANADVATNEVTVLGYVTRQF